MPEGNDDKGGRSVRMYDRPASADRPPTGRIALMAAIFLLAALLAAKFIFHVHFGLGHVFH